MASLLSRAAARGRGWCRAPATGRWLAARFRALRSDRAGTTAVEFGIVALPFLAALCAIFEVGFVQFEAENLANAVDKASRAMLTGRTQNAAVTTASQFVSTYFCPATGRVLPPNFDCSKLIVDVRPVTSFTGADLTSGFYKSSSNVFCPGAPGQIVVMRVAYPLPAILPTNLFNPTLGTVNDVPGLSGQYHILLGVAAFMEENFAGTYTAPAGC